MRPDLVLDADLSEGFRTLRERDRAEAPAFASLIARAASPTPRRPSRLAWSAGGIALAATVGAILILQPPPPQPDSGAIALPAWPTQTAFLLADAGASSRGLGWTSSPTSGLGQPAVNRLEEKR